MVIYLNIGSNRGDRRRNLAVAVGRLADRLPGSMVVSDIIETGAWGFSSDNPFLNVGVAIDSDRSIDPLEVLEITQDVQRSIDASPHRNASGAYIDRVIDIDIIAIDDIAMESPQLTLPHPRMRERDFVMIPMRQIAPVWLTRHGLE